MNLGKAIKIRRIEIDMLQSQLAKRVEVTTNYISLIETNKREAPGLRLLSKIANALGLMTSELIVRAENYPDPE